MRRAAMLVTVAAWGCSRAHPLADAASGSGAADAAAADAAREAIDAANDPPDGAGGLPDGASGDAMPDGASGDAVLADAHPTADAASGADASGPIHGGPCASGAAGATALRAHWASGGGTAYVDQLVDGLPDASRGQVAAYGYQIGFTASFVDPFLGPGGVALDDSDFIDLDLSTSGLASISRATLSIYGRSYDTTTNGSFSWQTFDGDGAGATATDFVSNVAPYAWYSADVTAEMAPGDAGAIVRVKAGPSSDSLVVNQIELCVVSP
jgi:hypothetical protein